MADFKAFPLLHSWFEDAAKAIAPCKASTEAKRSHIAIVGAGISGLMTSLLLDSVGLHNYTIIEASSRFGGRIQTEYFDNDKDHYVYQEMGAMRFPRTLLDTRTNKTIAFTDQQMVFQLADKLNEINAGNGNLSANFIPWYQIAPGNLKYVSAFKLNSSGLPPNYAQIQANASLLPVSKSSKTLDQAKQNIAGVIDTAAVRASVASNIFKAHHDWVLSDHDDFDAFGYLHNELKYSLDVTDQLTAGALGASTDLWNRLFEASSYFSNHTIEWITIDRGMSQLANAFWGTPAANRTVMGRKIFKVDNEDVTGRVRLHWKPNDTASVRDSQNETYDYAIISVPFSVVRYWRLPNISDKLARAIRDLKFSNACKVALQFSSRFWERAPFEPPIHGGCSVTDLPGIGFVCYPSYRIGQEGPAVLLAEYVWSDDGDRLVSWSDEFHSESFRWQWQCFALHIDHANE